MKKRILSVFIIISLFFTLQQAQFLIFAETLRTGNSGENVQKNEDTIDHAAPVIYINKTDMSVTEENKGYLSTEKITAFTGIAQSNAGIKTVTYIIENKFGQYTGTAEGKEHWIIENPPLAKGINGIKVCLTDQTGLVTTETITLNYSYSEASMEEILENSGMSLEKGRFKANTVREDQQVIAGDIILEEAEVFQDTRVCFTGNLTVKASVKLVDSHITVLGNLILEGDFAIAGSSVLELYGDLNHLAGSFSTNEETSGKILLSGETEHHISFTETDEKQALGRILADNSQGNLWLDSRVYGAVFLSNTRIIGTEIALPEMDSNGYVLSVEGNYRSEGNTFSDQYYISGDFLLVSDSAVLGNGILEIQGDLRIQAEEAEGYSATDQGLQVKNQGLLAVGGDFYVQTTAYSAKTGLLSDQAILKLCGNLRQIGTQNTFRNVGTGYQMEFTGEAEQHVSFDNIYGASLGRILVHNLPSRLYLDTAVNGITLLSDTTFQGEAVSLLNLSTEGYRVKIIGDFFPDTFVEYADIHVKGDVLFESGTYYVADSIITIDGNLRIQTKKEDGTYGMARAGVQTINGQILVNGDIYSYSPYMLEGRSAWLNGYFGGVEVRGDLYIQGEYSYMDWLNSYAPVVFTGNGDHHIYCDNPSVMLRNICQSNPETKLYLHDKIRILNAASDLTLANGNTANGALEIGSLYANDYKVILEDDLKSEYGLSADQGAIVCRGDVTMVGTGAISSYGGAFLAEKNVYLTEESHLQSSYTNGRIIIKGDVYNDSTSNSLIKGGALELGGNLYQRNKNSCFMSGISAYTQLMGENRIEMVEGGQVHFYNMYGNPVTNVDTDLYPLYTEKIAQSLSLFGSSPEDREHNFGKKGVYTPTGNYSHTSLDMTVYTATGSMEISHTYNSQDEGVEGEIPLLGKGFTFSHNMKLSEQQGYCTVIMPEGNRWVFVQTESGGYEAQNNRGELVQAGEQYRLKAPDGTQYLFNSAGALLSIQDKSGNKVEFSRSASGHLHGISDNTGTSIVLEYEMGHITRITNEETGETVVYTYEGDKLVQVKNAWNRVIYYEYAGYEGRLSKLYDDAGTEWQEISYHGPGNENEGKIQRVKTLSGNVRNYYYDELMMQTRIVDSNGRTEIEKYDFNRSLSGNIDAVGLEESVSYQLNGGRNQYNEIVSKTDAYGNTTKYEWDDKGNVKQVIYPDGGTELFTYDIHNNLIKSINQDGAATYYVYDAEGKNLLKVAKPLNGTTEYKETANQDLFAITTFTYYQPGEAGNKIQGLVKTETGPTGDSRNYVAYQYNAKGLKTAEIKYIDGKAYTTQYKYNEKQQLIQTIEPDSVVTEQVYNAAGQVIRSAVTDARGEQKSVIRKVYNKAGLLIQEVGPNQYQASADDVSRDLYHDSTAGTTYTYNAANVLIKETDTLGRVTRYESDLYGNVTEKTLPDGSKYYYQYDAIDRVTETSFFDSVTGKTRILETKQYQKYGRDSRVTTTLYLEEGRTAVQSEHFNFAGKIVERTDPAYSRTRYTYTKGGNLATETDPLGQVTTYTYNAFGNVETITAPFDGKSQAKVYYTYDKAQNVVMEQRRINAVGTAVSEKLNKTTYEYDAWGNLLTTVLYDNAAPVSYEQNYYDFRGQLLRTYKGLSAKLTIQGLDQVIPGADTDYTVYKYEYDYLGNVVKTVDGLGQTQSNTRDLAGNILTATDKNGALYQAEYDALGRVIREEQSQSGKETIERIYTYDSMDNITSVSENGRTETYAYDGLGNRIKEVIGSTVKEMTYDTAGELLSVIIREKGEVLRNTRNTYDNLGRLTAVLENGEKKASYTYDAASRLLTTEYANGTRETNIYNQAGLVLSTTNRNSLGDILSQYHYTYTVDGNQVLKQDETGTTTYTYDGLGRLQKVINPDASTETYVFDDNSNRTEKRIKAAGKETVTTYRYNQNDQLLTKTEDGATTEYSYDGNGNLLKQSSQDETVTQTFDLLNRMVSWSNGDETAEYTYQSNDLRAGKTVDGVTTKHIWIGSEIAVDVTESRTVLYIHGIKLIESDYGIYLYDARGDVKQLMEESGRISLNYAYDPFGIQKAHSADDQNPYRYCGEYYDQESGYVYLRARYYSPELGRFVSMDAVQDGSNWYIYCGGDPVNRFDPSGNAWWHWLAGAAVVVVAAVAVVATGGGALGAIGAVAAVGSGTAAATPAATIAAAGLIAAGSAYAAEVLEAERTSNSLTEFAEKGSWRTVTSPLANGVAGAGIGALSTIGMWDSKKQENVGKAPVGEGATGRNSGVDIVGTNHNEIKPTQDRINPAKVAEYADRLRAGEKLPSINGVEVPGKGKFILNGHHRYVASQLTGIDVDMKFSMQPGPVGMKDWSEVFWKRYINETQFWD